MASAGSWLSGVLVAVGWYIFFDGLLQATADCVLWNRQLADHCGYNTTHPRDHLKAPDGLTNGAYWAPGIIGFLGAIILNRIRNSAIEHNLSLSALADDSLRVSPLSVYT